MLSYKTESIFEQNEDIMAAIVENMQLGRIDDCLEQYSLLLNQLIPLSVELDNFPLSGELPDFHEMKNVFPDRLMRKDILDDLRPHGDFYIPSSPPPPVCLPCHNNNVSVIESFYGIILFNIHICFQIHIFLFF
jgi:hypothetical protein